MIAIHPVGPVRQHLLEEGAVPDAESKVDVGPLVLAPSRGRPGQRPAGYPRVGARGRQEGGPQALPLDDVDRAIVAVLREDGRISMRALAARLHISRSGAYLRGCWDERELARMFLDGGGPPGFELIARRRYRDWIHVNAALLRAEDRPLGETLVLVLTTLGLLFVGLLAVAGFTVMAQRRLRALGMLGSMGATDRHIRLVMLAGGAAVGATAAIVGTLVGQWLVRR